MTTSQPDQPMPDQPEIARLRRTLATLRLRYANLLAAARATLAAAHEGEPDPLAYLADELTQHPMRSTDPSPTRDHMDAR
jgi:hypothetical protein